MREKNIPLKRVFYGKMFSFKTQLTAGICADGIPDEERTAFRLPEAFPTQIG